MPNNIPKKDSAQIKPDDKYVVIETPEINNNEDDEFVIIEDENIANFFIDEKLLKDYDNKHSTLADHQEYTLHHFKQALEGGANIDAQNKYGQTALECAVIIGYEHVAEMLLNNGASKNVTKALMIAYDTGHTAIATMLEEYISSQEFVENIINSQEFLSIVYGKSTTDMSIKLSRKEIHNKFLDYIKNSKEFFSIVYGELTTDTPVILSREDIHNKFSDYIKTIKKNDKDSKDAKGESNSNNQAANIGNLDEHNVLSKLKKDLVKASDADKNYQNKDGLTALHIAVIIGYEHVAEMLLKNGADPSIKNSRGHTALDIANMCSNHENPIYKRIATMIKNHIKELETQNSKDNNDKDNSANDTDSKDAKGTSDSNGGNSAGQNNLSDMPGNVIDNNDSPITLTSNKENLLPSDTAEETSSKSYGAGKIKEEFNKKVEEFSNIGGKSLATFLQNQFTNFAELIEQLVKQEMSLEDLIKYGIKNIGVDYTKLENSDHSYYRDNSPMVELPPLAKTFDQHLPGLNTAGFNTDLS